MFDAEIVTDAPQDMPARSRMLLAQLVLGAALRSWRSDVVVRLRSVAVYRARKAPADVVRLVWFVARGNWRWLVKPWNWATYADLRADAVPAENPIHAG